jgi:hypothetical protein
MACCRLGFHLPKYLFTEREMGSKTVVMRRILLGIVCVVACLWLIYSVYFKQPSPIFHEWLTVKPSRPDRLVEAKLQFDFSTDLKHYQDQLHADATVIKLAEDDPARNKLFRFSYVCRYVLLGRNQHTDVYQNTNNGDVTVCIGILSSKDIDPQKGLIVIHTDRPVGKYFIMADAPV